MLNRIGLIEAVTDQRNKQEITYDNKIGPGSFTVYVHERDDKKVLVYHNTSPVADDPLKFKAGKKFAEQWNCEFYVMQPYVAPDMCINLQTYVNDYGEFQRPTETMIFMNLALMIAKRSTCLRKQVGAVFTDEKMQRVLCFGYNGNVAHGPNQCDSLEEGQCGCIHAEINALTKNVGTLEGSTCFVTLSPCVQCAKVLINRGIKRVIYHEQYRNVAGIELLRKSGVDVYLFG